MQHDDFLRQWNDLPRAERLRLRRLVRLGRPVEPAAQVPLALAYAEFQRSRVWSRLFWLWFVPGLLVAVGVAATMHPVVIGVVLALGTQAVFARRNLRRAERVNASVPA